MNTYTITYHAPGSASVSGEAPTPERAVEPGDIYEFTEQATTLASVSYTTGDTLEMLDRTAKAPHHLTSSLGNLVVRCKHGTSVWTNIEWLVAEGILKLKSVKT